MLQIRFAATVRLPVRMEFDTLRIRGESSTEMYNLSSSQDARLYKKRNPLSKYSQLKLLPLYI